MSTTAPFWGWLFAAVIALVWSTTLVVDFRAALTVLMAIGFGMAVIGLRYPLIGLLGIGMLCTLNEIAAPLLLKGGLWRWNIVNYWLLLVILVLFPYLLKLSLQTRVLLPLILLLGVEILVSQRPVDGIQNVFAVSAVFGILIYFRRAPLDVKTWYWLGVVTGVLGACGSAAFLLQQGSLPYVNPNVWSYLPLTSVLIICLAFVGSGKTPRQRSVLLLLAAINAVWVFLSGSRGSLLITAICLAFLLTMMQVHRALLIGIVAALLSFLILSQFTPLQEKALSRLRLLVDSKESFTMRTSGRFDLALGGWYIFQDHPFGVGTGGFPTSWADLGRREGLSRFAQGTAIGAHSGWVKILAENGVPGILLLAAYVVSFTASGWRARRRELLRLGMLVSGVLSVAWVSTEFQNKALWFVAAGATVLLDRKSVRGGELRGDPIAHG